VLSGDVCHIGNSTTKSGRIVPIFSVPCPKCNRDRIIKRHNHAINHLNKACKFCNSKSNHPQGEYKGFRISWWSKYETGASYRNIDWNITIDDGVELFQKQNGKCALTGLELTCSGDFSDITASLDRINNNIGYTIGNIQFVHKDINMMRGTLSMERFIELCKSVADRVKW
jgi:hypothetical protein